MHYTDIDFFIAEELCKQIIESTESTEPIKKPTTEPTESKEPITESTESTEPITESTESTEPTTEPTKKNKVQSSIYFLLLLLSYQVRQGHFCLHLDELPQKHQWPLWQHSSLSHFINISQVSITEESENLRSQIYDTEVELIKAPHLRQWFRSSSFVFRPEGNGADVQRPLVFQNDRVYFFRDYKYEKYIQSFIQSRYRANKLDEKILQKICEGVPFFNKENDGSLNFQQLAVVLGLLWNFLIISGGPGTGKTTTIIQIISTWFQYRKMTGVKERTIAILAPTGKAVMRLKESLNQFFASEIALYETDALSSEVKKEKIREIEELSERLSIKTIHSFLGSNSKDSTYKYNRYNKRNQELVIIDEASLLDIPLFVHLLEALPNHNSLILVGDSDQLSSVNPGQLIKDLCSTMPAFTSSTKATLGNVLHLSPQNLSKLPEAKVPHLSEHIVFLDKNYRFSQNKQLISLTNCIKAGEVEEASRFLDALQMTAESQVMFYKNQEERENALRKLAMDTYLTAFTSKDSIAAFHQYQDNQVLTALRSTSVHLNDWFKSLLESAAPVHAKKNYPIIMTRNDRKTGLYNGDVGALVVEPNQEKYGIFMIDGKIKKISIAYLNHHDDAFAITIHKSQGSEYKQVILCIFVLDPQIPILNRELFYTGVSRAKDKLHLFFNKEVFLQAIRQQTYRHSGLNIPFLNEKSHT